MQVLHAELVARAENHAAAGLPPPRPFFEADMAALPVEGGPYHAILCVGNSIATQDSRARLDAFLSGAARLLAPGGRLILQSLNFARFAGRERLYQPVRSGFVDGRETLFLKVVDVPSASLGETPRRGRIDIVVMQRQEDAWTSAVQEGRISCWSQEEVDESLRRAGFTPMDWYGDHEDAPYDPSASVDLICVARL